MELPPIKLSEDIERQEAEQEHKTLEPGTTAIASDIFAIEKRSSTELAQLPESLPVLEAFQEFLEQERARMRRRTLKLISSFAILFAVFAIGTILIGFHLYRALKSEYHDVHATVAVLQDESKDVRRDAQNAISQITEQTEQLSGSVSKELAAIKTTRDQIEIKARERDEDLEGLKDVIKMLETENTYLKQDIGKLKTGLPEFAGKLNALMSKLEALKTAPPPASSSLESPGEADREDYIVLSITPRGGDSAVAWRMPIPE